MVVVEKRVACQLSLSASRGDKGSGSPRQANHRYDVGVFTQLNNLVTLSTSHYCVGTYIMV